MRWLRSLAVCAGFVAGLAQAAVPEALSEAFIPGMTLSVKFGDTSIQDDSITSAGSITSSPIFSLSSPENPIPDNTRFTIILMDITDSRNPTTEAVLHYAASNLRAPAPDGGELVFGTVNFEYIPPAADTNNADYLFMVYAQLDGDIELNLQSVPEPGDRPFSVNIFRQDNLFQLADAGTGFTIRPTTPNNSSTTSSSSSTTSFTFPNTTTTFSSTIPSSTPEESSTIPSNSTTTSSSSDTETTPPPERSTSYLTLSISGLTRTVIYTAPNDPGSTLGPAGTTTSANPSLITNEPSVASHKTVPRAAITLLAVYIALFAFI